jgi:uncharacterized protein YxjI
LSRCVRDRAARGKCLGANALLSEGTLMSHLPPAGWHPDPFRRFQHRYWDGARWTEHVSSDGRQWTDPPTQSAAPASARPAPIFHPPPGGHQPWSVGGQPPPAQPVNRKIQKQVQRLNLADAAQEANRGILGEPVLVINQRGKLVELRAEYAIYNQHGLQLAAVRGKRVSSRMEVVDMNGRVFMEMRREASLVSSKVNVTGTHGAKIGRLVPSMHVNHPDRAFKVEGFDNQQIGAVLKEHRTSRREFNVQDANGSVVAQISKTYAGVAKEMFTKGDNYVLTFPRPVQEPLRSLSIAATLLVDSTFHQQ